MSGQRELLPFDPKAWLSDIHLRECCDLRARGALIDLVCLAFDGSPRGFLSNGGLPVNDRMIAGTLRVSVPEWMEIRKLLLETNRVKVNDSGVLYIPRMVRDAAVRAAAKEGGALGGNPALKDEEKPGKRAKAITARVYFAELPLHLQTKEVRAAVEEWVEYRQRKKFVLTERAVAREVNLLSALKPQEVLNWFECAISKQWRSVYPPPENWTPSGVAHNDPAVADYAEQIAACVLEREGYEIGRLFKKIEDAIGKTGLAAARTAADAIIAKRRGK